MGGVVASVQTLPFADKSFDLVIANYMLYHATDIDQALGELRRVLRTDGLLVAATNGPAHLIELLEIERAIELRPRTGITARSSAHHRPRGISRRHFGSVSVATVR